MMVVLHFMKTDTQGLVSISMRGWGAVDHHQYALHKRSPVLACLRHIFAYGPALLHGSFEEAEVAQQPVVWYWMSRLNQYYPAEGTAPQQSVASTSR